jgi:outer membrane protein with beta-barrel domain
MLNKNFVYAVLFLLLIIPFQYAQISIKLGPMIGMTVPTIDYSGDTKDFYTGTKYGMRSGINYGVVAKVGLLSLNGRFSISYASLSNDGIADATQNNSTVNVENNIVLITIGPEFSFGIPKSPVKPYAGIDLLFSSISGNFDFQGSTPNGLTGGKTSIQSASRTGLGFSFGSEIQLGKLNLDLSLRYNLHNLFGKEYTPPNRNNKTDVYAYLNDAKDPNYAPGDDKHPVGNDRTIATIQLQLGLLFGF